MSFATAAALQTAVYQALVDDAALSALVGDAIYDAPLPRDGKTGVSEYVTLGSGKARARSSAMVSAALHEFVVTVHSSSDGFRSSKDVAAAICDVLLDAELTLSRGHVVFVRFLRANADTGRPPEKRRISLIFQAFIEDI